MAKSYNNLWQKMIDPDNIEDAIYRAAKGKRKKAAVIAALADVSATVCRIKGMLERDEWRPPEVRRGRVFADGIARKKRILVEPDFDEQIIHHLLIDHIIQPIFQPGFFEWSCGSIPGRGQEAMAKHIMKKVAQGGKALKWCAVLDIKKCFQTISTAEIYRAIARKIRDRKVLNIVRLILDANKIELPDGEVLTGGVPIGLFTSPWFVNIALTRNDHTVKDCVEVYVRYIDDMLFIHTNRRELKKTVNEVARRIGRMDMRLKLTAAIFRFGRGGTAKVRFTGFHFTHARLSIRDKVFIRARRLGANIRRKLAKHIRVTAYDAERLISYGGRFRAFGSYAAFPRCILCGINFALMRHKVAMRNQKERRLAA